MRRLDFRNLPKKGGVDGPTFLPNDKGFGVGRGDGTFWL